jgi:hypothetical protein
MTGRVRVTRDTVTGSIETCHGCHAIVNAVTAVTPRDMSRIVTPVTETRRNRRDRDGTFSRCPGCDCGADCAIIRLPIARGCPLSGIALIAAFEPFRTTQAPEQPGAPGKGSRRAGPHPVVLTNRLIKFPYTMMYQQRRLR